MSVQAIVNNSKHECACIPMAAVHINTSSVRVWVALLWVWAGPVFRQPIIIYTAYSKDTMQFTTLLAKVK